jgi:hypothetical protein
MFVAPLEAATPAPSSIPRRVVQFWDQPPPPEMVSLGASWCRHNPDFEHRLVSDIEAEEFLRDRLGAEAAKAFRRGIPLAKADIFRLGWLLEEGGVFADVDTRCLGPIASILPEGRTLVLYQDELGGVGSDFVAATPHHPMIETMFRLAVEAVHTGDVAMLWASTGGGMMTRVVAGSLARNWDRLFSNPEAPLVLTTRELWRSVQRDFPLAYKRVPKRWQRTPQALRRDKSRAHLIALCGLAGVKTQLWS